MKLKKYIEQLKKLMKDNKNARQFYSFILKNGIEFKADYSWKKNNKEVLNWIKLQRPKKKNCFYNSQLLAIATKLRYFEGWGYTEQGIPLEHSFCVNKGKVVDVTWDNGKEYFGVEIPLEFMSRKILKSGWSKDLLNEYFFEVIKK